LKWPSNPFKRQHARALSEIKYSVLKQDGSYKGTSMYLEVKGATDTSAMVNFKLALGTVTNPKKIQAAAKLAAKLRKGE